MKRIYNALFYLVGVGSTLFLAWAIIFRESPTLPPEEVKDLEPDSALIRYVEDEMDYRTNFSKVLVKERIAHLEDIALIHPEFKSEAMRVIDSLEARLDRGAVVKKKEE